jgi:ADP-ribosyl-[dinitrogen reductase] hydrolase
MNARMQRYRGSLLGLAVGDALGTTLEFKPPGTFPLLTDMVGGGLIQAPATASDQGHRLCCSVVGSSLVGV